MASFAVLFTPYIASARGGNDDGGRRHRKIGAKEMALPGFGVAALLGVAGYLALRKRTIA